MLENQSQPPVRASCHAPSLWGNTKKHKASRLKFKGPGHQTSQPSDKSLQDHPRNQPTKARATTTGPPGSVHEEPTAGRFDRRPAHGALAQLLATVAVAADHVATGHQNYGWAMLVADGARHAGATGGATAVLLFAGTPGICTPRGSHL